MFISGAWGSPASSRRCSFRPQACQTCNVEHFLNPKPLIHQHLSHRSPRHASAESFSRHNHRQAIRAAGRRATRALQRGRPLEQQHVASEGEGYSQVTVPGVKGCDVWRQHVRVCVMVACVVRGGNACPHQALLPPPTLSAGRALCPLACTWARRGQRRKALSQRWLTPLTDPPGCVAAQQHAP